MFDNYVLRGGFVGPPLVGCPPLLIQYIRGYRPYWRPSLHPLPEDGPCCGDRGPLIMVKIYYGERQHIEMCSPMSKTHNHKIMGPVVLENI